MFYRQSAENVFLVSQDLLQKLITNLRPYYCTNEEYREILHCIIDDIYNGRAVFTSLDFLKKPLIIPNGSDDSFIAYDKNFEAALWDTIGKVVWFLKHIGIPGKKILELTEREE